MEAAREYSTGYAEPVDSVEVDKEIFHGICRTCRSRGSRRGNIPRDTQKSSIPWKSAKKSSTGYAEPVDPVEAGEEKFRDIRKTVYIMEIKEEWIHDIRSNAYVMEIEEIGS